MYTDDLLELQAQINLKNTQQEISPEDKERLAVAAANANAQAVVEVAKNPETFIAVKLSNEISEQIDSSAVVKQKVATTAEKVINTGLKIQENKVQKIENQTDQDLKKDVYTHFGINTTVNKAWKRKMYEVFDDCWDIILGVAMGFTIVPISKVMDRYTHLSNKWLRGFVTLAGLVSLAAFIGLIVYGVKTLFTQF